jgi:hypothetical protein
MFYASIFMGTELVNGGINNAKVTGQRRVRVHSVL